MWRRIAFLGFSDLGFMLRHRETLMWMFVMPVLFMGVIGAMMGAGGVPTKPVLAVLDQDRSALSRTLMQHLGDLGYEVRTAETPEALASFRRQLTVASGFGRGVMAGTKQTLQFKRAGEMDLDARLDQVRLNRAMFRTLGDVIATASVRTDTTALGEAELEAALAALRAKPPVIDVEIAAAGRSRIVPSGFQQSVPGTMIQFILMVLLTTGGTFLVVDRELGLLRRLAASPYSRTEIVLGKVLARFATGITQAAFAMLAGTVLFRVDWGNHLMGVLLVLCLFVFSGSTLSVLVGSLARSRGQAVGLGVLVGNVLSALGGCWWPIEIVAPIMQKLAWCLPTGWAMYALHRLISFGDGIAATLPSLLLLFLSGVVFLLLGARAFRYQ